MLQRDYISRLIREFTAALQRYLEKKEGRDRQEALCKLYNQYFGDYAFYHVYSLDDIMKSFEQYAPEERLPRMEMLAELYYTEADLLSEPLRTQQLELSLQLFQFIDRHDSTYSIERIYKMNAIDKMIHS